MTPESLASNAFGSQTLSQTPISRSQRGEDGKGKSLYKEAEGRNYDVSGRRALRSAGMNRILVPLVTSTTVGSRAFPVAAPLIWNSVPDDVISALPTFQRKLERHLSVLSCESFPGFGY